ncbi:type II toxin-antitoxin system VapC family toxin [Anatilimnocola sp. NA78]|uniref:type II toxin-antitoxin system VapC family toxin n=1 Tax=Anatilimnocola sp. NA78 TaxID=3415683 RepID=UPI003CE57DF2
MREDVVVDTGAIVAILRAADARHEVCLEQLALLQLPLFTTWLAITEAAWLLRGSLSDINQVIALIESNSLECVDFDADFAPWCRQMLAKYHDLKPQLADLSLVYIANQLETNTIFTLDRRDFTVYRNSQEHPFDLLPAGFEA